VKATARFDGCAERFIRTLKENLLWVRYFETIEELRQALIEFKEIYNTTWLVERHGPAERQQAGIRLLSRYVRNSTLDLRRRHEYNHSTVQKTGGGTIYTK